MAKNLRRELQIDTETARRLLERLAPLLKEDETAQHDAVEGQTDLFETIDAALKRRIEIDILVDGIGNQMDKMAARRARLKEQDQAICSAIMDALESIGCKTLERALGTLTVAVVPRGLDIHNEAKVPSKFWVTPKPDPKIDRVAVKAALSKGELVEGAKLDNGGTTLKWSRK